MASCTDIAVPAQGFQSINDYRRSTSRDRTSGTYSRGARTTDEGPYWTAYAKADWHFARCPRRGIVPRHEPDRRIRLYPRRQGRSTLSLFALRRPGWDDADRHRDLLQQGQGCLLAGHQSARSEGDGFSE